MVIDPGLIEGEDPRPQVLTVDRQVRRLSVVDFTSPVEPIERIRIPKNFSARSASARRDLALTLRQKTNGIDIKRPPQGQGGPGASDVELQQLRNRLRKHLLPRLRSARGPRAMGAALPGCSVRSPR